VTRTVTLRGMAAIEHRQPDGTFAPHTPDPMYPPKIGAGDRLRVRLEVDDGAWLYAVSSLRQTTYWKLGAWGPGERAAGGIRLLWPGGHALTADEAAMTLLFVVASAEELPWAKELTRTDCSHLKGQPVPEPQVTPCDHLVGLSGRVQPRMRGPGEPAIAMLEDGAAKVPALAVENRGAGYTALEWQFKPRK
jgi:hypothetical protein